MRRLALTTAVVLLSGAAAAEAYEFKPSWGYGFIDEAPFNEPGGALLPSTQVFPRGYIRDTDRDGRDVRLTVFVFTPGKAGAATDYKVDEGDFQNKPIDRRLDIWPSQISYLAYDFCRFNPVTKAVEVCEERVRIGRPSPTVTPTPTLEPTATATPVGSPPPPTDADGDGFAADVDCSDRNATVFPGAPEIPGNLIDDDCTGGDAPARLVATVRSHWTELGKRLRIDILRVSEAPEGATVEVTCRGRHCPFKSRTTVVDAKGEAPLLRFFKRRLLRPRLTIDVRITYPNTIGKVARYAIKRVAAPPLQRLCLPPGEREPRRC